MAHDKLSVVCTALISRRGAGTEARARAEGPSPEDPGLAVLTRAQSAAVDVVVVEEAVEACTEDDHVL